MLTWTLFGSVAHLPECRAPHLVKWLRCASSSCPGGVDLLPTVQAAVRVLMTISAVVSAVAPAVVPAAGAGVAVYDGVAVDDGLGGDGGGDGDVGDVRVFFHPAEEFGGFAAVLWSGATCTGSLRAMRQEPTPSPPSGIGSYTPYRTDGSSIWPSPASAARPAVVV